MNGYYIRHLAAEDLARRIVPFLVGAGLLPAEELDVAAFDRLVAIVSLERERLKTLAEAPEVLGFFFEAPDPVSSVRLLGSNRFAKRHSPAELWMALGRAGEVFEEISADHWSPEHLETHLDDLTARLGWKRAELFMPVRIAVSGREATPPLFETLVHLGQSATVRRLQAVVSGLASSQVRPAYQVDRPGR